jgi:hypothetical protein
MLVTRGALTDLLARHPLSDTAAMGKRKTSYQQLLGLTRAIWEQIMRSPVGPAPTVIAADPGADATIATAQFLGREYFPLSANHPVTRIQQIFAAVEPTLIVQSYQAASRLAGILTGRLLSLRISRQLATCHGRSRRSRNIKTASLREGNSI